MIENVFCLMLLAADAQAARQPVALRAPASYRSLAAPQSRNAITGTVYNPYRRPVQNLRVELLDEVDGLVKSTYTDSGGRFYFFGLTPGNFQVRVLGGGTDYETRTERVLITGAIMRGRGGQSETIDIIMSYKRGRGPAPAAPGAPPSAVFAQEIPAGARESYERALKEWDDEKPKDEVLLGLRKAIAIFPEYYAALDLLGQEYIKRREYGEAETVLTKAVTVNPRSFSSWYSLGYAQYKLKRLPAAAESLTKSAGLGPKSINTHLILGTVQRLQKAWGHAEESLKRAASLTKKPLAEIHWQLALLYNQTGRNSEAADQLDLFLKAQPDARDADKIRKLIADLRQKQ